MTFAHVTVLPEETVDALGPVAGGVYADVTLGGGGHAERILERSGPDGRLLALDRDPAALEAARVRLARFGARATFVHGRMSALAESVRNAGFPRLDGVVADLGVSSPQFDDGARGFSFSADGPLDMRMDPTEGDDARSAIAALDADELANVIYRYGEEHRSRAVARSIKQAERDGALETTADLRRAVIRALGPKRGRIDPSTKTFQALRIHVNDELGELESLLRDAPEVLREGGVLAIISFHSLEDRMVKHTFRDDTRYEPLWKRPLIASDAELEANPRARSAKLRAARVGERSAA